MGEQGDKLLHQVVGHRAAVPDARGRVPAPRRCHTIPARRLFADAAALKAFLDQTIAHLPEVARAGTELDPPVRAARGG
jgi:hypothetical protein